MVSQRFQTRADVNPRFCTLPLLPALRTAKSFGRSRFLRAPRGALPAPKARQESPVFLLADPPQAGAAEEQLGQAQPSQGSSLPHAARLNVLARPPSPPAAEHPGWKPARACPSPAAPLPSPGQGLDQHAGPGDEGLETAVVLSHPTLIPRLPRGQEMSTQRVTPSKSFGIAVSSLAGHSNQIMVKYRWLWEALCQFEAICGNQRPSNETMPALRVKQHVHFLAISHFNIILKQ